MNDIYVARQPIFDRDGALAAYELLYRGNGTVNAAFGATPDAMSRDTVVNTMLGFGLERLCGGRPAFVNCTREYLDDADTLFLPGTVTVEILESVEPDEFVVATTKRLRDKGYTIALDDFVYSPKWDAMLELAHVVKLDVLNKTQEEIAPIVAQLRPFDVQLLAERVETAEVRDWCEELGFDLFQGYFYAKPEMMTKREVPTDHVSAMRLLNLLRDARATDAKIEEGFRTDPTLSYKLLRIVNSASMGGRGVQSIGFALRLIGREALYRWLALLMVSSMGSGSGIDGELIRLALIRARLCELVAGACGREAAEGPLFMVGLLSKLDALVRVPMDEILTKIDVVADVRAALLGEGGQYTTPLALVAAYERGDFDDASVRAKALGLDPAQVADLYVEALGWVRDRLASIAA